MKLAQAVLWLVDSPTPPMRLPMVTDTLQVIRDHVAYLERETAELEALAASSDFAKA